MQVFKKQYPAGTLQNYAAVLGDLGVNPYGEHFNNLIVDQYLGSPYRFGVKMREAVQDENAPIYSCNGVYWCVAEETGMVSFCRSCELNAASVPSDAVPV